MVQTRAGTTPRRVLAFLFLMATALATLWFAAPAWATKFTVTRTDDPSPGGCQQGDC